MVPIFMLLVKKPVWKKYGLVAGIIIGTFVILSCSNKLETNEAIAIIKEYTHTSGDIDTRFYIYMTNSVRENRAIFFKDPDLLKSPVDLILYVFYIIILIYISKELFTKPVLEFNWLFLFPILLCFVALDWARWLCFAYFLSFIFLANNQIFSQQKFKTLLRTTIIVGIPIAVFIQYSFLKLILIILFNIFQSI
jgi:hypothetical protein